MKRIIGLVLVSILLSCKAKQAVIAEGKAEEGVSAQNIIASHYLNKKDFKTVYLKADVHYQDKNNMQNINAEIKIKKDEKILVSIRVLGITMAKALITPETVKYYEKINGEYFEGDYKSLSQWLGTDLDFQKVQNLLLGQAMDDLTAGSYTATIEEKLYKLESQGDPSTIKTFYFESERYLAKRQQIEQPAQNRKLTVNYPGHNPYPQAALPTAIIIEAIQPKGKTQINVDYKSASFNEELSFPYSVPEGYERIFID